MPRQLPWKNNGGGSRTQRVKPSPRPRSAIKIPDDIDDGFLCGTVFASISKGKAAVGTDDSLPELPAEPSTPRTKRLKGLSLREEQLPSSSPPPLSDYALPHTEPMRKGVSKFDLWDDEWMMVEDEFLETAKLFTRHLHIAEYDRMKEIIEAKKKEAEAVRPVVAGAKRSIEGAMKERAKVQESKQKKAIRDVFASQGDTSEEEKASIRPKTSTSISTIAKSRPATMGSRDTDSDDLDAPRAPKPKVTAPLPAPTTRLPATSSHIPKPATSSFAKPALPAPAAPSRSRARLSRMTPFDMLDEYTPPKLDSQPRTTDSSSKTRRPEFSNTRSQSSSGQSTPQISQTTTSKTIRLRPSLDLLEDEGAGADAGGHSKEVADRTALRRLKREKESDGRRKRATDLVDIPTFLF